MFRVVLTICMLLHLSNVSSERVNAENKKGYLKDPDNLNL